MEMSRMMNLGLRYVLICFIKSSWIYIACSWLIYMYEPFYIFWQMTEKLYKSQSHMTRLLRFTVPFPILAFPIYLVRSLSEKQKYNYEFKLTNKSWVSDKWTRNFSGAEAREKKVLTLIPTANCSLPKTEKMWPPRPHVGSPWFLCFSTSASPWVPLESSSFTVSLIW